MMLPDDPDDFAAAPEDTGEGPSKSERKREMAVLQDFGETLLALPKKDLAQLPINDRLADALAQARTMKQREARRRQLQFIGRLLREDEPGTAALQAAHAELAHKRQHFIQQDQRAERWQQRLLAEGDAAINELLAEFPTLDRQPLRQLVRKAQAEQRAVQAEQARDQAVPPAPATAKLFRQLRETVDQLQG